MSNHWRSSNKESMKEDYVKSSRASRRTMYKEHYARQPSGDHCLSNSELSKFNPAVCGKDNGSANMNARRDNIRSSGQSTELHTTAYQHTRSSSTLLKLLPAMCPMLDGIVPGNTSLRAPSAASCHKIYTTSGAETLLIKLQVFTRALLESILLREE
ncbi:hypothetical protein CBL_12274 [Carabus blaptoides fortunei]